MRDDEHHPNGEEWMRDWRQRAHDAEAEVERLRVENEALHDVISEEGISEERIARALACAALDGEERR